MGIDYAKVISLWGAKNGAFIESATTYGEPGYTDPEKGIIFANWNNVPQRIQEGLESQGFALEWSDEWYIDYNNGPKAYRTQPDSYQWESRLMPIDGDYLTPDDGIEAWVEQCEDNAHAALPSWWDEADIAALGWKKTSDTYEAGFHPGQNDNPQKIADKLRKERKTFMFQIDGKGQFDIRFHVWIKE